MKKGHILLLIAGIVILLLIAGIVFLSVFMELPENIIVNVDSPVQVKQNQEFNINVTIKNTANNPQKLVSIDVRDSYLKGISIKSSDPPYKDSFHLPVYDSFTYDYHTDIPANGELDIVLTAAAVKTGDFRGDIELYIDEDIDCVKKQDCYGNCLPIYIRTVVSG
ncbi:MAG: hypothetical protein A7316_01335 [Candidatus Altiarchaeales archaeon WOR_SM1_86-2]|nr:MAG: hypothetical protein A7315_05045 [Candidatus Altiarchaeales archaeon WOR_SM1_79]ODS37963.1 MAG: hypothetical protein A7316_01335 [Candidatus Altiarchaeales archaeon WOR_SM1_86-2]